MPSVRTRFSVNQRQCYFQDEVITDKAMGIGRRNRHRSEKERCSGMARIAKNRISCPYLNSQESKCRPYFKNHTRTYRYSLSNCFWQATVSHSTEVCGCKMWNYGEATKDFNFCVGENLTCFRKSIRDFGKYNTFTDNNNKTYECFNVSMNMAWFLFVRVATSTYVLYTFPSRIANRTPTPSPPIPAPTPTRRPSCTTSTTTAPS